MTWSRLHVCGWGLAAASFFALLSASLGPAAASAGNCAMADFTFNLGSTNLCPEVTRLKSTGDAAGVNVFDSTPGAWVMEGDATAQTGAGNGVVGFTSSSSVGTHGVVGTLANSAAGASSAAVYGNSSSTNANGPGVLGSHLAASGTAPGVVGQTASATDGSTGVEGLGGTCGYCLGVYGTGAGKGGGVRGESLGAGEGWGLEGIGTPDGIGAYAHPPPASTVSYGVEGGSGSTASNAAGVYGTIDSHSDYAGGVRG